MADTYLTVGSTGIKKKLHDNADADGTHSDVVQVQGTTPYPLTPVLTVSSPGGVEYTKITPSATMLKLIIRPRTITQSLIYAPLITHRIADATNTIGATDPDDLPKSKTAADEILTDVNAHIAATAYHAAAGAAWYAGHKEDDATNLSTAAVMSNLGTGYTLADELAVDFNAHTLSTVFHAATTASTAFGATPDDEPKLRTKVNLLRTAMIAHFGSAVKHSVADPINAALATATTVGSDEASDQTLINLLQTYWNSHCAVGDATAADLAAVVVAANAAKAGTLAHMADTSTAHGGTGDATNHATLTAVAAASDLATSITLLHALKDTFNAHCAITDGGAYITAGPVGLPIDWPCAGAIWVKTDTSAGVFTTAEWRSS
jgi:hypothetical protein